MKPLQLHTRNYTKAELEEKTEQQIKQDEIINAAGLLDTSVTNLIEEDELQTWFSLNKTFQFLQTTEVQRELCEMYVSLLCKHKRVEKALSESNYLINDKLNPLLSISQTISKDILAYAKVLNITPSTMLAFKQLQAEADKQNFEKMSDSEKLLCSLGV